MLKKQTKYLKNNVTLFKLAASWKLSVKNGAKCQQLTPRLNNCQVTSLHTRTPQHSQQHGRYYKRLNTFVDRHKNFTQLVKMIAHDIFKRTTLNAEMLLQGKTRGKSLLGFQV